MILRKINAETGIFIRDVLEVDLLEDGTVDSQYSYVEKTIPDSIYAEENVSPKWTGAEWVSTAERPETQPQQTSEMEEIMLAITELAEIVMGGF